MACGCEPTPARAVFAASSGLEEPLEQAQGSGGSSKAQREAPAASERNARQQAARERAARERLERVHKAMAALEEVKQVKARARDNQRDKRSEPRASTTDSEARVMMMPDGGFRPAYNVQVATDTFRGPSWRWM